MRKAISFGRVFGVELLLDTSWLLILGLIVWSLTSVFSASHPSWTSATVLAVALMTGISFFASVLVHELAHTLAARAYGLPVRSITLHMFGGVSNIEREPSTPGAELTIAAVGPLASIALGVAMIAVARLAGGAIPGSPAGDLAMAGASPTTTLLMWLGPVNIALGAFNLIPGFPMDGGRVLRAVLWKASGDFSRATRWSTSVSQGIGVALMAAGALMVLGLRLPFFGTGVIGGFWLGLIGMFVRGAAKQHQLSVEIANALAGVQVRALMRLPGTGVQGNTSARALVAQCFSGRDEAALPVFFGERFVGMVARADLANVPAAELDEHTARVLMRGTDDLPPIASSDSGLEAFRKVSATGLAALPVVDDGELVGMLLAVDVTRWVALHRSGPAVAEPRPRFV